MRRWSVLGPLKRKLGLTDEEHGHVREGYTRVPDATTGASALSARKDYLRGLPGTADPERLGARLGSTPRETRSLSAVATI